MKTKFSILFILIIISSCKKPNEKTYKNEPVIKAKSTWSTYKIDEIWHKGSWTISPKIAHDTLNVTCYKTKESFKFKTDMDSISFDIVANTTKGFYVKLGDSAYAHTVIKGVSFKPTQIKHDTKSTTEINIKYQTKPSKYLEELKKKYPLDFIKNTMSDKEKVLAILNWTNSQWKHNGGNSPSKSDAITILNEAKAGSEFPCFAYAIVLKDQLNALGYKARTVYLKTKDAEHRKTSPGHVVTEVFLNDIQKWVFLDGQFNVMPTLNGVPLNAVEFQNAINTNFNQFELNSLATTKTLKRYYINFVYDYLYYFDTSLDNRYEVEEKHLINGKKSMMLVPLSAKNLNHIDFWNLDVNYCIYTNSFNTFYAKP